MKSHYLSKQAIALVHPPPVGLAFSIESAHHATGLLEAQWEQAGGRTGRHRAEE